MKEFDIIPTPKEFAIMMRECMGSDFEMAHSEMDYLMGTLLISLGYDEAMEVFTSQTKWYA